MSYSCHRKYHLYDTNNERDKYYRETAGRWQNCTHERCPLRYNTKEIPRDIQIPYGYEIPKRSHESKLNRTYKGLPTVESNPAPAGSLASPRIPFSSLRSPLTPVSVLTSPPEPERDSETLSTLPVNLESITDDSEEETEEEKEEKEDEPIPKPGRILQINPHEDLPIRRAQPSFMAGTITTTESISTAREFAFGGGGGNPGGGGGGSGSGGGNPPPVPANPPGQPGGGGGGGGGGGNPPNPPLPVNPPVQPILPQGKGKIKDPEIFNGDRSKTRSFLNQLFLLFTARPHDFTNDHTKIATALSFMEGDNINYWKDTAIRLAEEEIQPGIPRGFGTWAAFKQAFQVSFAPVDEVNDSMVQLTTIQLRDYASVDEFNARFMDLAVKGNILDSTSQLALYRQALPDYLLRKIALSYPAPTTIADWMVRTKEIDQNYQLTEKILANRKTRKAKTTRKAVKIVNTQDDTEVKVNRLTEKERKDLQDKGLCFRCRKAGHISRNCPAKPKNPGRPFNHQVRKVHEESSEDETEDSDEEDEDLDIKAVRATDFNSDFQ